MGDGVVGSSVVGPNVGLIVVEPPKRTQYTN